MKYYKTRIVIGPLRKKHNEVKGEEVKRENVEFIWDLMFLNIIFEVN